MKQFLNILLLLVLGLIVAGLGMLVAFLTDGDYRYWFIANMILFITAGFLSKRLFKFPVYVSLLVLSIPYWAYYATQIGVTPRIVLFPFLNIIAIFLGTALSSKERIRFGVPIYTIAIVLFGYFTMPTISLWVTGTYTTLPAPEFEINYLEGKRLTSTELKGKVVVVDFWATWCKPCIAEFKELKKFHEKFQNDERVALLVINEDSGGNDKIVHKFLDQRPFHLPFFVDDNGSVYKSFGADSYPMLYLIDQDWNIRWINRGFNSSEDLSQVLENKVYELL